MGQPVMWLLKGVAMGAANVIPGVSGGTIAFITGIYQRLIDALKSFDLQALRFLWVMDFKTFAVKTDIKFLWPHSRPKAMIIQSFSFLFRLF